MAGTPSGDITEEMMMAMRRFPQLRTLAQASVVNAMRDGAVSAPYLAHRHPDDIARMRRVLRQLLRKGIIRNLGRIPRGFADSGHALYGLAPEYGAILGRDNVLTRRDLYNSSD
jgi:hypothetical protein